MSDVTPYTEHFSHEQYSGSLRSARKVVPEFIGLYGTPQSVVDVGGGLMPWLEVFGEHGTEELHGLDSVEPCMLPMSKFQRSYNSIDLNEPFSLDRRFDLAVSLEVGEHLLPSSAENFVDSLSSLSDVVLFSAAIPGQGGFRHINEQWQSWWASKFLRRGFLPETQLRTNIWGDEAVEWWYRQNVVVYVRQGKPLSGSVVQLSEIHWLDVVHPACYIQSTERRLSLQAVEAGGGSSSANPADTLRKVLVKVARRSPKLLKLSRKLKKFRLIRILWAQLR